MEIEIQGIPQSLRPSYQARIKASKADLTRYKKLSKDVHAQLSRAELLARPGIAPGATRRRTSRMGRATARASSRGRRSSRTGAEGCSRASGSRWRRRSRVRIF